MGDYIISGSGAQYPLIINADGSVPVSGAITSVVNFSGLTSTSVNHYVRTIPDSGLSLGFQENTETIFIQNTGSSVGLWCYLNGSVASGTTIASGGYIGMLGGLSFDLQVSSGAKISLASESGATTARVTVLYG